MSRPADPTRRLFLRRVAQVAGASALAACGSRAPASAEAAPSAGSPPPAPPDPAPSGLPDGLDRAHFHVHNEGPLSLETRRGAHGRGVLTPNDRFFVRNNLPRPADTILDDRDAWAVAFEGVAQPRSLTLAELKTLGLATEAVTLQCSGNGRAFFAHDPSGSPWATGAAGCAIWTGVRLRDVWAHLGGVDPAARFLTATGGEDLPEGVDRDTVVVERSVPVEKGLADALLAWDMNGAPIPLTHGGPLRLIVPGYFGVNHIKYVRRIGATVEQTTAKIQKKGYRFRPIGQGGSDTHPSMWRMPVKSWLNGPGADGFTVPAGQVVFYGVALSGERGVEGVEVSLDGGRTWSPATLEGPALGPNAWRAFSFATRLPEGTHTVHTRATDTAGEQQPRERVENERGYGHNGWLDHGLRVVVTKTREALPEEPAADVGAAPRGPVVLSEAGERGKVVFESAAQPGCGVCHTLSEAGTTGAVGPNLDALRPGAARVESAVTNGVGAMPGFGGRLSPEQIRDVAAYVAESTGG
jgi:DMSO/TMAO reductase YedYZ molybdopterin-dependent catalytic subunit/mono/diheme cytochrome c family protein